MKLQPKKLIALLLAGLMTLSVTACAQSNESTNEDRTQSTTVQEESGEETKYDPGIEVTNYDCEFVITGSGYIRKWSFAEENSAGDPFQDAIHERALKIQDHLGVTLVDVDSGSWTEYSANVLRTIQSGDDAYQMVATQTYEGVPALMSSGAMYDFAELDGVNLDAPYWSFEYMDGLTIQDQYLLGYNDYCLADNGCTACIDRCPAGAITLEGGHDKVKCQAYHRDVIAPLCHERYDYDGYAVCGLCQTGVPCECGIPSR